MRDRQRLTVHLVGEDGLGMQGVDEIEALVVADGLVVQGRAGLSFTSRFAAFHGVRAVKDHKSSLRPRTRPRKNLRQGRPRPFADAAPAFDAIMARNLGSGWKCSQSRQRQSEGIGNEAIEAHPPIDEVDASKRLVRLVGRIAGSVSLEVWADVGSAELGRKPIGAEKQSLRAIGKALSQIEDAAAGWALGGAIAAH